MAVLGRMKSAWNAFRSIEDNAWSTTTETGPISYGGRSGANPRLWVQNERTIVTSIYTRMAIDIAAIPFRHVQLDEELRYAKDMKSPLNTTLTLESNLDQGPRQLRQDLAMTLFDKGVAAIVAVDTSGNPEKKERVDIYSLRIGEVVSWSAQHVRVSLYNEKTGKRQEITLLKRNVALVENPLYAVMNEPNSTLQRLIRKLALLDAIDEQAGSGKLDLIIQLPYAVKSEARKLLAEQRRTDIEVQLKGSQYGIAYADATEKITQLNRPAENNMMKSIEYLTEMLYGQLGITASVMNGTADEATMINYYNRAVEPVIGAAIEAMQRAFLGPIGTLAGERIMAFRDPFKLVPIAGIAEIADKFTRNEILSSNELRGYMGIPPSSDAKADQLVNSNMPQPIDATSTVAAPSGPSIEEMDAIVQETLDGVSADIDKILGGGQGGS